MVFSDPSRQMRGFITEVQRAPAMPAAMFGKVVFVQPLPAMQRVSLPAIVAFGP